MNLAKATWAQDSVPLLTAYVVSGLLAIIVPAAKFRSSVRAYQSSYYYEYQQANQSEDEHYTIDVNNCKWWQWRCTPLWMNENGEYVYENNNNNNNNNGDNNQQYYSTPSWFSGWGGNQVSGDRGASGDNNMANSTNLKVVYAWQLLLFLSLLAYGAALLWKFRLRTDSSQSYSRERFVLSRMAWQSLWLILFVWMNVSFMTMFLLANGSIYTEGREMEEIGGFYNQFSVMMFVSCFWQLLWACLFCGLLGYRICKTQMPSSSSSDLLYKADSQALSPRTNTSTHYLPYCEPSITVTGVDGRVDDSNNVIHNQKLSVI